MAPADAEYFPAGQVVQTADPADCEYFPAAQDVQTRSAVVVQLADMKLPAAQVVVVHGRQGEILVVVNEDPAVHAVQDAAAAGDTVPGKQAVHKLRPVESAYVPAEHCSQVRPETAPNAVDLVPVPQSVHVSMLVAPILVEYFPVPHCKHVLDCVAPETAEYVPA